MTPSRDYALRHPHPVAPGKTYPAVLVLPDRGDSEGDAMLPRAVRRCSVSSELAVRLPSRTAAPISPFTAMASPIARNSKATTPGCGTPKPYPRGASRLYRSGFGQGALMAMTRDLIRGSRVKGLATKAGVAATVWPSPNKSGG